MQELKRRHPFHIDAFVILPDHLHATRGGTVSKGELLPRAEQLLGDADWDSAARTASTVSDPLGGTTTPTRYQALYKAIAQAAGIRRT